MRSSSKAAAHEARYRAAARHVPSTQGGAQLCDHSGTSFDRVAPLLVACFLAQSSPAYDVKDPATHEKLMRLSLDDAFKDTYGLKGNHVEETSDVLRGRPAKELEALVSGCTGIAELDLFGGATCLR